MKREERLSELKSMIKESNEHHQSYMAKPQLFKIMMLSTELYQMICEGEPLPDWAESHIAKCEQMMQSVHGKIMYEKATGKREC